MAVAFVRTHTAVADKAASSTTVNLQISTAVPAGNVLVANVLYDNAATASKPLVSAIARAAGETNAWVPLGAVNSTSTSAGAFASGSVWAIRTSVVWPVATYAVTLDTAVTMKGTVAQEFSGALAAVRSTSGTNYSTTTTAASASTTGTTPVAGDLAVGFIFGSNVAFAPNGDVDTTGGLWSEFGTLGVGLVGTSGGNAATNNNGIAQYKILTAATHQTLNNSVAMTAGNGAIVAVLQQYVDPAVSLAAYRFYADGTETASTALAAQDAAPTVDTSGGDVNAQLRVRLQSTTAVAVDPWDDFQLQWEKNASGTWGPVAAGMALFDTYPLENFSRIDSAGQRNAQQIVGGGSALLRVGFRLSRASTITGSVVASLYASTGAAIGTGGPTGTALATSTNSVNAATLPAVDNTTWSYFDFDGATVLDPGSRYFVAVDASGASNPDFVNVGVDGTAPTHPGRSYYYTTASGWSVGVVDLIFEVYTATGGVLPYNSPNLTDAAATTNRLTGGTGTFTAGKVSEDGLADDVGWAGNNYTELLYSLTFKAADLTAGDTLRFRVLRNGATSGLTYTSTPTVTIGGGGGPVDKPIAGTVAGTSATAGTIGMVSPPKDYPLAGTVAAATASSGNPAATHPLAGAATGTTAAAGTIGAVTPAQTYPLAGTVAAVTATTGSIERVALALPLAGTLAATTTVAGTVTATHPLAGTTDATSTTVGSPAAVHPVSGSTAATSTTTGTVGTVAGAQDYPLAGSLPATSTTTGTLLRLNLALTGLTAGTSTAAGDPAATHPLTGTPVAAVSTTVGTTQTALPLSSTVAGITTTVGTPAAIHPLLGAVAGFGDTAGNATAVYRMTGAAAASSATSGTINMVGGAQDYPLAGSLPVVTTTAGAVSAVHPLTGALTASSTTAGDPSAVHPVAGTLAGISTSVGTVDAVHPLAGVVTGTSTTTGNPTALHPLVGTPAAGISTTSGTINLALGAQDYPLAGVLAAVSTTSGAIGVIIGSRDYPLAGTLPATTATAAGALRSNLAADGIAPALAATYGDPTARHPLAAAQPVVATSTTAGSLGGSQPLAGTTVVATTTTIGTPQFNPALAGTVAGTTTTPAPVLRLGYALAATTPATTGTTGSIRGLYTLTGAAPASSATVGYATARRVLATNPVIATTATYGRITPRGYTIPRPNPGQTPQPDAGISQRPNDGRTAPTDAGTTTRPAAGTVTRPREYEHA